jgi:hypothetical protein
MRKRSGAAVGLAFACSVAVAGAAATNAAAAKAAAGPLGKVLVGDETLKADYLKSRGKLAIDPESGDVVSAGAAGAKALSGTVADQTGQRLILKTKAGATVALFLRDPQVFEKGAEASFAAKPSGTYVYRDPAGPNVSLDEYLDLTPGYGDYVQYRRGPSVDGKPRRLPSAFKKTTVKVK